jgi:hypothetical protein
MKRFYILVFTIFVLAGQAQISTFHPGICMVTVDDSSKHNIVYYDKTQASAVDSFILYRESNNTPGSYTRILANDSAHFSMFMDMDTAGNPNIRLHRYKLQIWHHIGGYSPLGPYHTALFCLQQDSNYNWNQYDIEGVGTGQVQSYLLLQDDNSTGLWHPVDTVSGTGNSWVDAQVALFPNGQWRLATLWGISCSPTARYGNNQNQTTIVKSKSNITNNRSARMNTLKVSSVILYPNPANTNVTVRMNFPQSKNTTVKLYSMLGSEVQSFTLAAGKDELNFDVGALPKGIYVVEIANPDAKITKRLSVN